MKVKIDKDEWYPVYTIDNERGRERELPAQLVADLWTAQRDFEFVQDRIREHLERHG